MTSTTRERAGKSKDIIRKDGKTFFEFTDRITAFDGLKKDEYPDKGEVCCRLSAYWFEILEREGGTDALSRLHTAKRHGSRIP